MQKPRSMGSHQSARAKTVEWLTPPDWIEKLGYSGFDLDPCCPPNMPWETADVMLTKSQDGLTAPWYGRVWLNPPFGKEAVKWLRRLKAHGNGIALIPARTETDMYYETIWGHADSICFVQGRPHFHVATDTLFKFKNRAPVFVERGGRAPCNSGVPIALVAYGSQNRAALVTSELGVVVPMDKLMGAWPLVPQPKLADIVLREAVAA